jgi:hypothetical protein
VFAEIVPVLLVLALVLVLIGPRIQSWARRRAELGVPPACGGDSGSAIEPTQRPCG